MKRKSYYFRFSISSMIFIFLIIPHFKPSYFNEFDRLDFIFNVLRIISAFVTVILFCLKKCRLTPIFYGVLLLQSSLFFSTILNGKSLYPFISSNLLQIAVFMLINLYIDNWGRALRFLLFLSEILTYSNLFAIIMVPNGLYISRLLGYYHNWILGYKNQFFPFFFFFVIIAVLYNKYEKHSFRPYILICAMMISLILARSSTSTFVFVIFIIMILLMQNSRIDFVNPVFLIMLNIFSFFWVVVFRGIKIFNIFITTIFDKDITLTGRTYIWNEVIRYISMKPIFGLGVLSDAESLELIGIGGSTAHNTILQYWFEGGMLSVAIFLICNILFVKKLYKLRACYTVKVLTIGLFIYNLACLVEYYANPLTFLVYAMIDNVDRVIMYENQQEDLKTYKFKITYGKKLFFTHRKNL